MFGHLVTCGTEMSNMVRKSSTDAEIRPKTQCYFWNHKSSLKSSGNFLCIRTPNTGQLNPLFHIFEEFRPIVNRVVARQSSDWLVASAQFSPNDCEN